MVSIGDLFGDGMSWLGSAYNSYVSDSYKQYVEEYEQAAEDVGSAVASKAVEISKTVEEKLHAASDKVLGYTTKLYDAGHKLVDKFLHLDDAEVDAQEAEVDISGLMYVLSDEYNLSDDYATDLADELSVVSALAEADEDTSVFGCSCRHAVVDSIGHFDDVVVSDDLGYTAIEIL